MMKMNRLVFALMGVALVSVSAFAGQEKRNPDERSKATFGILEFDADAQLNGEAWWAQRVEIMNSIAEMMTTAMVDKGYRLIERKRLADILKEQDLGTSGRIDPATAAKIGKVIGCDYLILGAVTQWGIAKKGGSATGVLGRVTGVGAKETKAEATIDIRIVNSTTGEIMIVGKGKGSESKVSAGISIDWWKSVNFENSEWYGSMVGKATRKAVDDCIKKVDPKAFKLPSLGLAPAEAKLRCAVVAVLSATEAVIELDAKNPVKVGDVLTLKRITKQVKKDGKVIFEDSKVIGKVEVTEVQDAGAKVKLTTSGEEIKEGDVVEK